MIPQYVKDWITIIEGMRNSNTYKLAWGRALLELVSTLAVSSNQIQILDLDDVAEKILKLYWNQTFFFKLKQGPINSEPEILQIVNELIRLYVGTVDKNFPVWFDLALPVLKQNSDYYYRTIKKIVRIIKQDVSFRFMNLGQNKLNLYKLDFVHNLLILKTQDFILLKEFNYILSQLLNYRWSQLLESFNRSPNITNKVKGLSQESIPRKNLIKFKKLLLEIHSDDKIFDFYTNEIVNEDEISLDHFVPWSFMYQDDLWNLVITTRSVNSSKSNKMISEDFLEKLNIRNREILNKMSKNSIEYFKLKESVDNNFPTSFYYDFRNTLRN